MAGFEVKQMAGNKPVKEIGVGQVRAAIWENEIKGGKVIKPGFKVSVDRRYKDQDGKWKSTQSFSQTEIPLAIHCLGKAFDFMVEQQITDDSSDNNITEERVA